MLSWGLLGIFEMFFGPNFGVLGPNFRALGPNFRALGPNFRVSGSWFYGPKLVLLGFDWA